MLGAVEIPEHHGSVLTAGGTKCSVRGDTDSVDVPTVSHMIDTEDGSGSFHIPNLDQLVPTTADEAWLFRVGGETSSTNPLGVSLIVASWTGGGKVCDEGTLCVPEFDGLVTGCGDDLSIIRREGDASDVIVVAEEDLDGLSGL